MKLYLKSGQVVTLNEVHTVYYEGGSYGVGKFYDPETDVKRISLANMWDAWSHDYDEEITFYYDICSCFTTRTNNIVAINICEED